MKLYTYMKLQEVHFWGVETSDPGVGSSGNPGGGYLEAVQGPWVSAIGPGKRSKGSDHQESWSLEESV